MNNFAFIDSQILKLSIRVSNFISIINFMNGLKGKLEYTK